MDADPIIRRRALIAAAASLCMPVAFGQDQFPSRPITMLVGFAPGGQSDILTRKMAKLLEDELAVPLVVKNVPGAASTLALRQLATAKPDGYTLAVSGGSGMVMAPLIMSVPYTPKSFKSIGMLTSVGGAIAVHPSVPAHTLPELVQLLKRSPDKYSYAHSGAGGIDHLTGEMFKKVAGDLKIVDVPYAGSGPATQAVVAGQVPVLSATFSSIYKFQQSGQLRVLAITSTKRSNLAPEVPTAVEQGYPEMVAETYNLVIAPDGIPEPVQTKLRGAVAKIIAQPSVIADLKASGFDPVSGMSPDSTDAFLAKETVKWQKIVKGANITAQ